MLRECANEVVVLTLETNTKTHEEITNHLQLYGLNPKLYKVKGVANRKNDGNGKATMYQVFTHTLIDDVSKDILKNHMDIIRDAYGRGVERLMVLEDDARFVKELDKQQVKNMIQFLKKGQWDIFFLGYCPWPYAVSFPIQPNIVSIPTPLLAHAYIINRSGMEKMLEYYNRQIKENKEVYQVDKMFSILPDFKKTGAYPSICFQNKSPALFDYSRERLKLPFEFNTLCKYMEHFALLWPIFVLLVGIYLWIRWYMSKKN